MQLDGVWDLAGWQWVFVATGVPVVVMGVVFFLYMTDKPRDASWLPEDERQWLIATMRAEQESSGQHSNSFVAAMKHPSVWVISAVNLFIIVSLYGVSVWLPRIVKDFAGSNDLVASFLSAVPYVVVVVVVAVLLVARHSDATRERHLHVAVPCLLGAVALACTGLVSQQPALALGVLALASAGIYSAIPPMWGLPNAVLGGPAAAAATGLISAIENVGNFVGPSIAGFIVEVTGEPTSSLAAMGGSLALA